jgi:hypothetical protein
VHHPQITLNGITQPVAFNQQSAKASMIISQSEMSISDGANAVNPWM